MKILLKSLLLVTFVLFSTSTFALTINGTEVGLVDTIIAQATLANSGNEETDWLALELGSDFELQTFVKDEEMGDEPYPSPYPWTVTDEDPDVFAYDFGELGPYTSYFLIKLGGGNEDDLGLLDTHFLFSNDNRFAVVDLWEFIDGTVLDDSGNPIMTIDVYRISHIGYAAPVPEPSTLLLLGAGITGLAFYRRKKH